MPLGRLGGEISMPYAALVRILSATTPPWWEKSAWVGEYIYRLGAIRRSIIGRLQHRIERAVIVCCHNMESQPSRLSVTSCSLVLARFN